MGLRWWLFVRNLESQILKENFFVIWYPVVSTDEIISVENIELKYHTTYKKYNTKAKAKDDFEA